MFLVSIQRVIRAGIVGFFRNAFVSFATMLVMMITLFVIGALLFMNAGLQSTLEHIKQKVDINIYFVTDAPQDKILELKKSIESLPEVAEVTYLSREKVLETFKMRHKDDQAALQTLEELNENPFGASLAIRAKEPNQYEAIAKFLTDADAVKPGEKSIVDKVKYNKTVIDRLNNLIHTVERIGFMVSIFLTIASIMIVFNTIRLAIYTNKDEIAVMQLVGASNWFVRGPYVIEGALYGLVAGLVTLFAFYPIVIYIGPISENFFGGFNALTFYINEFSMLFKYIVGSGVLLGVVSSFLAVRRYLGV